MKKIKSKDIKKYVSIGLFVVISVLKIYKKIPKAHYLYIDYLNNKPVKVNDLFDIISFLLVKLKFDALKFWDYSKYENEIKKLKTKMKKEIMPGKDNNIEHDDKIFDIMIEILNLIRSGINTAEEIIILLKGKYPEFKDKIDKIFKEHQDE